ncbi:alpha-2-macroglobulin family protein [Aquibaculum arenosum]|uniref:MG2 domain-containing protein n=1 Tax=Aquibaculum arenosum TaxID=3032591 RepID=A0ABT5YNR0_9PROT|nr:MG2 domain-containing protein [Fodinicurvata sp. CAU 1616]MDF2096602.1 MG2 domain-containing protein [Fodinicurvata sp. CAU 1616]
MVWRLASVVAGLFVLLSLSPAEAESERRIVTIEGGDYFGFDLETVRDVTLDDCSQICLAESECRAFTYNLNAGWCFLKSDYGELRSFDGAVAGRVVEAPAPREVLARPDLSFLPEWVIDDAERYQGEVRSAREKGRDPLTLAAEGDSALQAGDANRASDFFRRALTLDPEEGAVWTKLARALLAAEPTQQVDAYELQMGATGAALGAVVQAPTRSARAEAYALLAEALVERGLFRPALESYKAGLALQEDAEMRAAFERLRAEHGFRVVDHTVDADAASPRICVQFSENLMRGRVDFTPYVTLDGAPPAAVTPQGQQLCVEGVEHGGRYRLALRPGLPSAVNEPLERQVNLDIYVRDRAPSVRFSGRAYVLPRVGTKGIPVISVNTEEVELELYRIGARGLSGAFGDNSFLSQLGDYQANRIAEETGEKLWEGTLDVRAELNEEVTSAIPIDEALPEREPGVYVLRARAQEAHTESWRPQATQWFVVSDIGLSTLMGGDGLHVFTRSLSTAGPKADVTVTLVARNNEILGEATADADGHVHFAAGLIRGAGGLAPGHLEARAEGADFALLDLSRSGFDLTDRGVEGRAAPGPVDIFLYVERGVYRPGETAHLTALVRDDAARAIEDLPLTFVMTRPDGLEDRRLLSTEAAPGAHVLDLPLVDSAMRGPWRVAVHADPEEAPIAQTEFLVEDFVPDRTEFDLTVSAEELPREGSVEVSLDGRFLYGAPAADIALEGELRIAATDRRPELPGYRFGLADEETLALREPLLDLPPTDEAGRASFDVAVRDLPATTRPLEATLVVALREAGGRAVEETMTLPIAPAGEMIGIRPAFPGDAVDEGGTAAFDLMALDAAGQPSALSGVRWELFRIERNFQWYRADGRWSYEPVEYTSRVADGTVDLTAADPTRITAPVSWGRYRLEVSSPGDTGAASSIDFTAGWYVETADADSPDLLDVSLDRAAYEIGETVRVTLSSRFAGTALVNVVGEGLLESREVEVSDGDTTIELEVTEDWSPGAYVSATVFRSSDAEAQRMPARAVGLAWLAVDSADRTLAVSFELPDIAAPRESLAVPLQVDNLPPGETAWLTVAAVDVGILNLTGFEPPEPEAWYFGQRALSMEMRDLYGSLIEGMLGETGRLRFGGGAPSGGLIGSPPTQEPVSLFTGPVQADTDGAASVDLDIPEFNGTLRLMAVAWSQNAVGQGTADLTVRDPVVITAALPRVLSPGDRSRLRLDLHNMEGPEGRYSLAVDASDHIAAGEATPAQLELGADARAAVEVPLTGVEVGQGHLTVRLTHEDGLEISQQLNITVRPAQPPVTERRVVTLEPGESLTLDGELFAGTVPDTSSVSLSVTSAGRLDLPGLLGALERFPYGCSEQMASRAMPLLYLPEVAREAGVVTEGGVEERIVDAIRTVTANQSSGGSFGLWGPGSGDLWLDAYITDFLTRARAAGQEVPRLPIRLALNNLANQLGYAGDAADEGEAIAYGLYMLARNQRAAISDLRYYADTALDQFPTPLAKAQLGAALALYGEGRRADDAFAAALADLQAEAPQDGDRRDYGSRLRDAAATLALAAEAGSEAAPLSALLEIVERERELRRSTSTQEKAWMLLAANALLAEGSDVSLEIDGESVTGPVTRRFEGERLAASPVTLTNRAERPVEALVGITSVPDAPRPANATGFTIERDYYSLEGEAVEPSAIAQNERMVVVLRVSEDRAWTSNLLVVDMLPAGFEIDSPRLVDSADIAGLPWLGDETTAAHTEFRDDRFVAAYERNARSPRSFTLAYLVRTVSPGTFAHPPAMVEDMYRPYLSALTQSGRVEVRALEASGSR